MESDPNRDPSETFKHTAPAVIFLLKKRLVRVLLRNAYETAGGMNITRLGPTQLNESRPPHPSVDTLVQKALEEFLVRRGGVRIFLRYECAEGHWYAEVHTEAGGLSVPFVGKSPFPGLALLNAVYATGVFNGSK